MKLLEDKGRQYKRYLHDARERLYLANQGFQWVTSSNVSAVAVSNNDLVIRFHNGSLYKYHNKGSEFDNILNSNSKGKWVWRNLRRRAVRYERIGSLPLVDDIQQTDEELFAELNDRYINDINSVIKASVETLIVTTELGTFRKIILGGVTVYQPM